MKPWNPRDCRERRDWKRPWREPPGFLLPECNCCSDESCVPSCPGVGTVGSPSGDECSSCLNTVISDDFSATLSSWLDSTNHPNGPDFCTGTIGPNFNQFKIVGGRLRGGLSGLCIMRSFSRPALDGLCIQVKAKHFFNIDPLDTGAFGITLGYGRAFFIRLNQPNFGRQSCVRQTGCVDPVVGSNFATFGSGGVNGDELSLIVRDQGDGDEGNGTLYVSICYQVNGSTIRVEEDVLWCPPETMYAGVITTHTQVATNAEWDDFQVLTS